MNRTQKSFRAPGVSLTHRSALDTPESKVPQAAMILADPLPLAMADTRLWL
jgi:hypothetical protein